MGHWWPSPLRYRHWMRGLSITEVMVNPHPLRSSWLPTGSSVDSLSSHCTVFSGRLAGKNHARGIALPRDLRRRWLAALQGVKAMECVLTIPDTRERLFTLSGHL